MEGPPPVIMLDGDQGQDFKDMIVVGTFLTRVRPEDIADRIINLDKDLERLRAYHVNLAFIRLLHQSYDLSAWLLHKYHTGSFDHLLNSPRIEMALQRLKPEGPNPLYWKNLPPLYMRDHPDDDGDIRRWLEYVSDLPSMALQMTVVGLVKGKYNPYQISYAIQSWFPFVRCSPQTVLRLYRHLRSSLVDTTYYTISNFRADNMTSRDRQNLQFWLYGLEVFTQSPDGQPVAEGGKHAIFEGFGGELWRRVVLLEGTWLQTPVVRESQWKLI